MKANPQFDWAEPWLERLRQIPGVQEVRLKEPRRHAGVRPDVGLDIRVNNRWQPLRVECKQTHRLNQAFINQIRHLAQKDATHPWILFAEHVTPGMGDLLTAEGINYVDTAGNCDLRLPTDGLVVHVQGKRPPPPPPTGRGIGAPGYRVLFALLARREFANRTVRELAAAAEVGKTTAAETLERLRAEGYILQMRGENQLVRVPELLERWLVGYEDTLRPQLLIGAYQARTGPRDLEQLIEGAPPRTPWAWGGGVAAERMTHHYRGPRTTVHANEVRLEDLKRWEALPAGNGNLEVVRPPCRVALDGIKPGLANPLLVYAELMHEHDERATEAAGELRDRYLEITA